MKLRRDLADNEGGCVTVGSGSIPWLRKTALIHWGVTLYAIELQGRRPKTLLLPETLECRAFEKEGEAILVTLGKFAYVRTRGQGWFDFDDAMLKARQQESILNQ
jgi:hypothetical protein